MMLYYANTVRKGWEDDRDGRMTVYTVILPGDGINFIKQWLSYCKSTKFALCRQLSCMCLLPEVAPNSVLDTANRMGKCTNGIKMLRQ